MVNEIKIACEYTSIQYGPMATLAQVSFFSQNIIIYSINPLKSYILVVGNYGTEFSVNRIGYAISNTGNCYSSLV